MRWWLHAVPTDSLGHRAAHADALLLAALSPYEVSLAFTTVDRSGEVSRLALTALVTGPREGLLLGGRVKEVEGPPAEGRCIRFPGQDELTGVHPAGAIVASSAVDEVVGVGVPVSAGDLVDTQGFVRPTLVDGRLVLLVERAAGGVLRPTESRDPHECCGGH
ncbi:hypothetical protein [Saccharothrix variisporea]|uniref:Uncharacterized protein n=1 Tax=Saccharothrix variisporea TaxID=543527 RepID=A0A495XJC1_9PSEU|nr:hypothetical protein [Saccharothrix variisporea]RKT74187.1 hypothetical protein DFJ66_7530 [Saccharothrix variisporea]